MSQEAWSAVTAVVRVAGGVMADDAVMMAAAASVQ